MRSESKVKQSRLNCRLWVQSVQIVTCGCSHVWCSSKRPQQEKSPTVFCCRAVLDLVKLAQPPKSLKNLKHSLVSRFYNVGPPSDVNVG